MFNMRITRGVDLWVTTRSSTIKQRLKISRTKKKLGIVQELGRKIPLKTCSEDVSSDGLINKHSCTTKY